MKPHKPPKLPLRFFRWFCHQDYQEDIEGDLLEKFEANVNSKGLTKAKWMIVWEIFRLLRLQLVRSDFMVSGTFQTMLKATTRRIHRERGYAMINILGLALGFTVVSLTQLYTQFERSYDQYIPDNHEVYRLEEKWNRNGETEQWAATKAYLSPAVNLNFPNTISTRLYKPYSTKAFKVEDKVFAVDEVFFADSAFMKVFEFKVLAGNKDQLLSDPGNVVISESVAKRFFKGKNPINQELKYGKTTFKVSGVIADIPKNAHLKCDVLLPLSFRIARWAFRNLNDNNFHTYLRISQSGIEDFHYQVNHLLPDIEGYQHDLKLEGITCEIVSEPITGIHLNGTSEKQIGENGNKMAVDVIELIGFFILVMSVFNYINLVVSRQFNRSHEVGVRKILGSNKNLIILQFLLETVLLSSGAAVISTILIYLMIPYFNEFFDIAIAYDLPSLLKHFLMIVVTAILVAIIAGIYPAVRLAGIDSLKSLKLNAYHYTSQRKASFSMRNMLTGIQLMVSAFSILSILIIVKQLDFIENKNLGVDTKGLMVIPLHEKIETEELQIIKAELYNHNEIYSASTCFAFPGHRFPFLTMKFPNLNKSGNVKPTEQDGSIWIRSLMGDQDIAQTFGLNIIQGRDFSKSYSNDERPAEFLINKTAADFLGVENPIGETVYLTYNVKDPLEGKIVGVVEDFNYASLHDQIEPVIIFPTPNLQMYLSVSFNPSKTQSSVDLVERTWQSHMENVPFRYSLLDDEFESHYRSENHLKTFLFGLTVVSIFIAVIGLVGMSFYSMERRKYEIGVRKILGASIGSILSLNLKGFLQLAIISNVLTIPLVMFFGESWLNNFAYRIDLDIHLFLMGFIVSMLVVLLSVSFNVVKSTMANPVEILDRG